MTLQQYFQKFVEKCLLYTNAHHICHDYEVGDCILKKAVLSLSNKLRRSFYGSFPITTIHTNGKVTIFLANSTIICHIKLYYAIWFALIMVLGKGEYASCMTEESCGPWFRGVQLPSNCPSLSVMLAFFLLAFNTQAWGTMLE